MKWPYLTEHFWAMGEGDSFGPGPVLEIINHEIRYEQARIYCDSRRIGHLRDVAKTLKKEKRREIWRELMKGINGRANT